MHGRKRYSGWTRPQARESKRLRAAEKRRQKQRLAVKGEEEIYDPSLFQARS